MTDLGAVPGGGGGAPLFCTSGGSRGGVRGGGRAPLFWVITEEMTGKEGKPAGQVK